MYDLNKICFLCLNGNTTLKTVSQNDTAAQVKYVLPELNISDLACICSLCCATVHTFYTFKKTCMDNYNRLMKTANTLQATNEIQNQKTSDYQTKTYNCEPVVKQELDLNFEINIKEENEDLSVLREKEDSDTELPYSPSDITAAENVVSTSVLPKKSLEIYENSYQKFMKWRNEMNISSFSENVILAYVSELAKNFKSSTLWSHYSMLKSTISIKNNINIGEYPKVRAYLKRKNIGYTPKKSRVFKKEQICKFIMEAPNERYLLTKVILIFGIAGGLRREELYKLKTEDIEDFGTILVVSVTGTNSKIKRKFTINKHLELYKKYVALRPKKYPEKKFFINFQRGKCTRQTIGINKFGKVPCEVAKYLKLPNVEEYTGHCFRRSSESLLAEAEDNLLPLKQHGGWKSSGEKMDITNRRLSIENDTTNSNIVNTSLNEEADVNIGNHTNFEDSMSDDDIEIIEERNAAKNIAESASYQQVEFVKCEIASDSEQNGGSSVTSEENNPFDKEDLSVNFDKHIYKDVDSTPEESNSTTNSVNPLLPEKSKPKYKKEYQNFCEWCSANNVMNVTENNVLTYFKQMNETKKATTLWASYSMLRTCLSIYKDIDISKYSKVLMFLKRVSQNYQPKKSRILGSEDIIKFINDAHNETYLAMKVILIMGSCGACRRNELTHMKMNDVEIKSDIITVNVPKTKTNISRLFVITDETWIALIKSYVELRPAHTKHNRFFLTYRGGRCTTSPIGINKIGEVPKNIAKFLKLPNPELYTGHCFRRSSVSHFTNQGSNMLTMRKHGEWKSSTVRVAAGRIDSSLRKMLK